MMEKWTAGKHQAQAVRVGRRFGVLWNGQDGRPVELATCTHEGSAALIVVALQAWDKLPEQSWNREVA